MATLRAFLLMRKIEAFWLLPTEMKVLALFMVILYLFLWKWVTGVAIAMQSKGNIHRVQRIMYNTLGAVWPVTVFVILACYIIDPVLLGIGKILLRALDKVVKFLVAQIKKSFSWMEERGKQAFQADIKRIQLGGQ